MEELLNRVVCGDSLAVLKTIPSESVDMVVTSPPYWALRAYGTNPQIWDAKEGCKHEWGTERLIERQPQRDTNGGFSGGTTRGEQGYSKSSGSNLNMGSFCQKCGAWRGELGLEPDFNLYIKHLCDIFDEVKRVLKKEGTCWVNIGDTFNSGGNYRSQKEGQKEGLVPHDWLKNTGFVKTDKRLQGLADKCLCQIPSRFAIEMCNRGWILRNRLIWHKPNCMPSSADDRFTVDFEDIFFFTKNKHYYFEQQFEPYTEQINRWGGSKLKANGSSSWDNGTGQDIYRDRDMRPNKLGRNKRCVWSIPTKPSSVEHYASYPEALIETPIKAGCPKDGIVMDIFAGSGTTLKVAKQLGRRYIGVELSPEYCAIAQKRLSAVPARLDTFCVNKPLSAIKL